MRHVLGCWDVYTRLFILVHSSATLNSQGRYSKTDSDWVSMFLLFFIIHQLEKNNSESDSNDIVSAYIIVVVVDSSNL